MPKDSIPALPVVPHTITDPQQRAFMQAVKDAVQTRAGQSKNKLDSSPTFRDLIDAGVITLLGGAPGGSLVIGPEHPSTPWDDITVPDAPTGVIVSPTAWQHHVQWDVPQPATESIMAYAEVWSSATNDRDTASLKGTARWAISLPIEPEAHLFYWIRFVSHANVIGAWSHARTDGVEAISPPDPNTLMDWLTDQLTESQLYQFLRDRIDLIDTPETGLVFRMSNVETTVDEHTGQLSVIATDITQLQTNVGDNYAAIQQNMQSIDGIEASYSVKTDVNGHVAGFGLINTGNQYDDGDPNQSAFFVSANTFAVSAPGNDDFAFIIDATNNRVVMDGAFILNATITGAAIKDAAIDTAHIGDLAVTTAKIENAAISNAKIGNLIQSTTYNPSQGEGWSINKSGSISAAHIQIYNHLGEVIIDSGKTYTTYHNDILNSETSWSDVSDIPDHLELAALGKCTQGAFGDIYFENGLTGLVTIQGKKLYLPDGQYVTFSSSEQGRKLDLHPDVVYGAGFIFFTQQGIHAEFPAWQDGPTHTSNYFFVCTFNQTTEQFEAWDGAATLLTNNFIPRDDTPVVATCSSNTANSSLDTFNSLIGVNVFLPEDGATRTPIDQMVMDPVFSYFSGTGTFTGDPNWAITSGSWSGHYDDPNGKLGHIPATRNGIIQNKTLFPVTFGVPFYVALQGARGSGTSGGTTKVVVHYFNSDKVWMGAGISDTVISISTGSFPSNSEWRLFTGVVTPGDDVSYATIDVDISGVSGDYIYLNTVNVAKAPITIDSTTIRTFIQDLSVDTLQIKGQAVTFSYGVTHTESWAGWEKEYMSAVVTRTDTNIPLQIHWAAENTTPYDETSGTRGMKIKRDGVQIADLKWFYKSGGSSNAYQPRFGTASMYLDETAPAGDATYTFSPYGINGWVHIASLTIVFTELKK